jgi:hypothetical protein
VYGRGATSAPNVIVLRDLAFVMSQRHRFPRYLWEINLPILINNVDENIIIDLPFRCGTHTQQTKTN